MELASIFELSFLPICEHRYPKAFDRKIGSTLFAGSVPPRAANRSLDQLQWEGTFPFPRLM